MHVAAGEDNGGEVAEREVKGYNEGYRQDNSFYFNIAAASPTSARLVPSRNPSPLLYFGRSADTRVEEPL